MQLSNQCQQELLTNVMCHPVQYMVGWQLQHKGWGDQKFGTKGLLSAPPAYNTVEEQVGPNVAKQG